MRTKTLPIATRPLFFVTANFNYKDNNNMADAGEAADEAEDDDEFVFEFCDEYLALALQTKLKPIRS